MNAEKYTLGLVSVSFRGHTPEEILDAAKQAGLSCIEWGSDVHAPCHDVEGLREIARRQAEYGIACSSYGTYFRLGESPVETLEDYIRAARLLDTEVLRLWCGRKRREHMTDTEREALLADCRRAAEIAEANGVTLCMECHQKTVTEDPEDAVWLMQAVDSPHFRMYWQPSQWRSAEQNLESAKKIAPYAKHVHVFHWKGDAKLSLTDGIAEWQSYLQCFSGPRTLLLEFMPNGTTKELGEETAALKTIAGEEI